MWPIILLATLTWFCFLYLLSLFPFRVCNSVEKKDPNRSISKRDSENSERMSSAVDATGNPIPTSAVLTASAKHIGLRCMPENVAFLKCKKNDPNPEKCLDKGRDVTRCVLGLLKDLHQKCQKEMDDYVGCMYYYTNEFDLCRKEQEAFEKVCPLK
ncbi:unnamed protein product [Eruca vesicaria subsp. sativa]|nr:unnamed protein product [Eruca vesicaria subsp. sativa]